VVVVTNTSVSVHIGCEEIGSPTFIILYNLPVSASNSFIELFGPVCAINFLRILLFINIIAMENDYQRMAEIYEGYRGHMIDLPTGNFKGRPPRLDYKNSYMPHGVANAGGAESAYAAGQLRTGGIEDEEQFIPKHKLQEYCDELRERGFEKIANELSIVINQAFNHSI